MGEIDGEVVTRETEATIKVKVTINKVSVPVTMTTEEIMTETGVEGEIIEVIEAETDISHIEKNVRKTPQGPVKLLHVVIYRTTGKLPWQPKMMIETGVVVEVIEAETDICHI